MQLNNRFISSQALSIYVSLFRFVSEALNYQLIFPNLKCDLEQDMNDK